MTELVAAAGALACFVGLVGGGPIWIVGGVIGLIWAYAKARQPRVGRDVPSVTAVQTDADGSIQDTATSRATVATTHRDVKDVSDTTERSEKVWTAGDRVIQPTYGLGTLIEIDERRALIDFDRHGPRTFSTSLMVLRQAANPAPRPLGSLNRELRHHVSQEQHRAAYEKAFPYDKAVPQASQRVPRRGPEVSGGLPSLGKRRP